LQKLTILTKPHGDADEAIAAVGDDCRELGFSLARGWSTNEQLASLGCSLAFMPTIQNLLLDLDGGSFGSHGTRFLCEGLAALHQLRAVSLDLRGSNLGDEGMASLAGAARNWTLLKQFRLMIMRTAVTHHGIATLGTGLSTLPLVTEFHVFTGDLEVQHTGLLSLAKACGQMPSLQAVTLKFDGCNTGNEVLHQVLEFLTSCPDLRSVIVSAGDRAQCCAVDRTSWVRFLHGHRLSLQLDPESEIPPEEYDVLLVPAAAAPTTPSPTASTRARDLAHLAFQSLADLADSVHARWTAPSPQDSVTGGAADEAELRAKFGGAGPGFGTCVVCWDRPVHAALVPCGHVCACGHCLARMMTTPDPPCPVCRVTVTKVQKLFVAVQPVPSSSRPATPRGDTALPEIWEI